MLRKVIIHIQPHSVVVVLRTHYIVVRSSVQSPRTSSHFIVSHVAFRTHKYGQARTNALAHVARIPFYVQ